jgi:hypothetical protein
MRAQAGSRVRRRTRAPIGRMAGGTARGVVKRARDRVAASGEPSRARPPLGADVVQDGDSPALDRAGCNGRRAPTDVAPSPCAFAARPARGWIANGARGPFGRALAK